jgi:hypothetical protein
MVKVGLLVNEHGIMDMPASAKRVNDMTMELTADNITVNNMMIDVRVAMPGVAEVT